MAKTVKITEMGEWRTMPNGSRRCTEPTTHTMHSEKDARDSTDLSLYKTVVQFNDVITMGQFIGEPVRN